MKLVLKEFQVSAVSLLTDRLRKAAREATAELQSVALSSPTGSGKTVMVTAAIEGLIQGDEENKAISDAVFLWITDQPQLNEQTRRKMLRDSSLFGEANLVTIGSAFDQDVFSPGTVNFVNIQKLGKERDLITQTDDRQYTIWETIANSIEVYPGRFFVIIDEAHRGMSESTQDTKEANTIIQKFIKGSAGEIPKVPIVLGISATPERFNNLVAGTDRVSRSVVIPADEVRASGLLKEFVTLYHPTEKQPTDITMLREAVRSWKKMSEEWERYCHDENEQPVNPILVIQVQDAGGKNPSKTDLDEVVAAIDDELGGIDPMALAHAFQEGASLAMNGKDVRYLAPPDVDDDPEVRIVFFKTSLNTGWDCPRAEVMMSFRTAVDATSIAQLVGRMVRTPLARRVHSSDLLNSVSLYLPHYDDAGLAKVIKRLTSPDPDTIPPVDVQRGENLVSVTRAPDSDAVFQAIEKLPSYIIPTFRKASQVRRLMKLARALANDDIDPDAEDNAMALLLTALEGEFERVKKGDAFEKLVDKRSEVTIRAVDWPVGLDTVDEDTTLTLKVSAENIDDIFEEAGRRIGDEGLHRAWWKKRRKDGSENTQAKLELIVLSIDPAVRKKLDSTAQKQVQEWLRDHHEELSNVAQKRVQVYDEVRGLAPDPELRPIVLPSETSVSKSDKTWKRHVYQDDDGNYPATLNKWETAVVNEELSRDKAPVWFRNVPRKTWSLTIPYEVNGKPAAFYPDFLFLREHKGKLVVDLLDPHQIDLADAPAKSLALAKFAAKHHNSFGRIELIIVRGDDILRIDLTDEAKRDKVLKVSNRAHLAELFDSLA